MPNEAYARRIVTASLPDNWGRPPWRSRVWFESVQQDLKSNTSLTKQSIWLRTNHSAEIVVCIWRYALLWCMPEKKKKITCVLYSSVMHFVNEFHIFLSLLIRAILQLHVAYCLFLKPYYFHFILMSMAHPSEKCQHVDVTLHILPCLIT